MRRRDLVVGLAGGAVAGTTRRAQAQGGATPAWPTRQIRLVVPYTPGGAVDAMARLTAQKLGEALGVNVVPDNRAGGNGAIGGQAVATAAPDGYTLLFSASIHVMAKAVMRAAPYDPVADFTPVARVGQGPLLLVTPRSLPQTTITEIVADARRNPDRWTFATSSLGSAGHLATIQFNRLAGLDLTIAPYRGSSPALADVVAGNIQLMIDPILSTIPLVRGGQLRAVAITAAARSAIAPEVPTAAESGMPGLEFASWYAVWGPRGLPPAIVERVNAVLRPAMAEPAVVARLTELGFEPVAESPAAFAAFIDRDVARNTALLHAAGFQPE